MFSTLTCSISVHSRNKYALQCAFDGLLYTCKFSLLIYLPAPWSRGLHPSWEAYSHLTGQEIPHLVCNWKFHDYVHLELSTVNTHDSFQHYPCMYAEVPNVVSSLQVFQPKFCTLVSYLIFMPLLPDLIILTFGEAQAHTHNFSLGAGGGWEAKHIIYVGKNCSCAVCVVSPQKFSTNNLSVFNILTYTLKHIFEA